MSRMPIEIISQANSKVTLKVGLTMIHGPQDPEIQAEAMIGPQIGPETTLVVLLGLGLGYYAAALRKRRPRATVLVWEPIAEIRKAYESRPSSPIDPEDDQIILVEDIRELQTELINRFVYGPGWLKLGLMIPGPYRELVPEAAAEVERLVRSTQLRQGANLRTILDRSTKNQENLAANFSRCLDSVEATAGLDALENRPAVIVAAGPSLEHSLDLLREYQERVVVIAVGTVFHRLVREGIGPDVVVLIEARDHADQISGNPALAETILAASSVGHPNHLAQNSRLNLVFHPEPWISRLMGDWSAAPDGGNVASAGFTLALLWGSNPIILVGQDLAYSGDRLYAEGARSAFRELDPSQSMVLPGNLEAEVRATREMVSYLSWYEESASFLARVRPGLELINSTEGGARIKGFPYQPLDRVMTGLDPSPARPVETLIRALSGFRRDPDLIRRRAASFRREAAELLGLIRGGSLDQVMTTLEGSFLKPPVAHLCGPVPDNEAGRTEVRRHLEEAVERLSKLAVELQAQAREWAYR